MQSPSTSSSSSILLHTAWSLSIIYTSSSSFSFLLFYHSSNISSTTFSYSSSWNISKLFTSCWCKNKKKEQRWNLIFYSYSLLYVYRRTMKTLKKRYLIFIFILCKISFLTSSPCILPVITKYLMLCCCFCWLLNSHELSAMKVNTVEIKIVLCYIFKN